MALLSTSDGISCDVCGSTHRDSFIYYSVIGNIYTYKDANKNKIKAIEFDMCGECRNRYYKIVTSHIDNAPQRGKLKDDFSDKWYDSITYMSMILMEVKVDKDVTGGVGSTNSDIDFNIAGDSLTSFLKQMAKIKEDLSQNGTWTTK